MDRGCKYYRVCDYATEGCERLDDTVHESCSYKPAVTQSDIKECGEPQEPKSMTQVIEEHKKSDMTDILEQVQDSVRDLMEKVDAIEKREMTLVKKNKENRISITVHGHRISKLEDDMSKAREDLNLHLRLIGRMGQGVEP